MEVCDPERVENPGQEDEDDPGVEDEPGHQEAPCLPDESPDPQGVAEGGEDGEHQEHGAVQEVVEAVLEAVLGVGH